MTSLIEAIKKLPTREMYVDGKPMLYVRKDDVLGALIAPDSTVDAHLDAVLRASGSGLRYFSMQKTLDDMRAAMRSAMGQPHA